VTIIVKKKHKCEKDGVSVEIEYEEDKLQYCPVCREKLHQYPLKKEIYLYGKEEELKKIGEELGMEGKDLEFFIKFFAKFTAFVNIYRGGRFNLTKISRIRVGPETALERVKLMITDFKEGRIWELEDAREEIRKIQRSLDDPDYSVEVALMELNELIRKKYG